MHRKSDLPEPFRADLEDLFNLIQDYLFIVDLDGVLLRANRALKDRLGYENRDLAGQKAALLFAPDRLAEAGRIVSGDPVDDRELYTAPLISRSGEMIPVETKVAPWSWHGQKVLLCTSRDLTPKLALDKALAAGEEVYRRLVENAVEGIAVAQDGKFVWANPRMAALCQTSMADLLAVPLTEFIHPDDRSLVADRHRRRLIGQNPPQFYDVRLVSPAGQITWVMISVVRIDWEDRPAILCFFSDVTERRRAEENAVDLGRYYQALFDASLESVICVEDGIIVTANQAANEMFGYQPGELIGSRSRDLVAPKFRDTARRKVVLQDDTLWEGEAIRKNGQVFPVIFRGKTITIQGRSVRIAMGWDMTEQKKAREQKEQLAAQLRQAQKMEALGTLAGGIAHDFNNILAIITGFAELGIEDAAEGVANAEALKTIQMAGDRGKNLVQQILTFSRKAQPTRARLNLNDRIAATIALLRQTLPKMIEINFQPAKDLPKIQADPGQIDQLIFNLCSNASDAMAGGGRLNIRTGLEDVFERACSACGMDFSGEYVYIEAADTGHGMSRDVLSNIFDPFFTTKEVGKGTGLGLSTVFGIAKGYGGHITCTSQVGEGSVFRVFLPVSGRRMVLDPDIDNGQTENGPTAVGRGETILLVDDEKAILDVGVLTLKRAGYKVLTAQSGEEALEIREREAGQIDLVILDLSMPGMGGRECLKQLLKAEPKLKVIIASGYSLADRQAASLPPGALTFLPKPFTKSQLLNTISEVLHLDRSGNGTVG